MAVARILETREVPEPIRVILEYIEDSEAFRIVRREVEAVLEEYPEEYEAIKHVLTKVMATLERDVDIVRERIMESPAVQKIIDYIMHLFNSVSDCLPIFLVYFSVSSSRNVHRKIEFIMIIV